jgi:hypothetical protein
MTFMVSDFPLPVKGLKMEKFIAERQAAESRNISISMARAAQIIHLS